MRLWYIASIWEIKATDSSLEQDFEVTVRKIKYLGRFFFPLKWDSNIKNLNIPFIDSEVIVHLYVY